MTIKLTGDLIIGNLEESFCELLPILSCTEETEFDLGSVSRIDSAGLQLLVSATHTLKSRQLSWRWSQIPPKVLAAAKTVALDSALGFQI